GRHRHRAVGRRGGERPDVAAVPARGVVAGDRTGERCVFVRRDRIVDRYRQIVDRGYIDSDCLWREIEVPTAVRGAAAVLYLEGKGGVSGAVRICRRDELEVAETDVCCAYEITGEDRPARQSERSDSRQSRDLNEHERICRRVI